MLKYFDLSSCTLKMSDSTNVEHLLRKFKDTVYFKIRDNSFHGE